MAQTQTSTIPGYLKDPLKDTIKLGEQWADSNGNRPYGTKPGESVYTEMNSAQKGALGNANWLADQDLNKMFGLDKASGLWDDYSGAGAELANKQGFDYNVTQGLGQAGALDENAYGRAAGTLSTNGVMDESGPLGAVSSYINPYLEQVLNPQIRELQEESERQRRSIGAGAAMAGAFGDARHGIMEGENFEKTNQAVSDTTGRTYSDAYNSAISQRQADMGRFDSMSAQDAALTENAQGRKLSAGQSNQASANDALARQLQGDIQTGQFKQAGAGMDQSVELANQAARQNATERLATAAQGAQSIGNNSLSNFMSVNDTLMNAGNFSQAQEEQKRRAQQALQEAIANKDYNTAAKMMQLIQGAPKEGTVTTESTDGLLGILGSVIGGIF
jgi:hypothetical protein